MPGQGNPPVTFPHDFAEFRGATRSPSLVFGTGLSAGRVPAPLDLLGEVKGAAQKELACGQVDGFPNDNSALYRWAEEVVLVRQRPGSAAGVVFMTIEDEIGITNVVVWPKLTERFRKEVMGSKLMLIEGRIQKSPEGVTHLVAQRLYDRTHELRRLSDAPVPKMPVSRADEILHPQPDRVSNHPRNVRIIPKSRDFH